MEKNELICQMAVRLADSYLKDFLTRQDSEYPKKDDKDYFADKGTEIAKRIYDNVYGTQESVKEEYDVSGAHVNA